MRDGVAETAQSEEPEITVVVPAYNEAGRIAASIATLVEYLDRHHPSAELLVVDDGSTDGTAAIVRIALGARPTARVLGYAPNRGKGYAVRYGMLHAEGRRVLFSDADLATPIEELAHLAAALDAGADIAIGSRDIPGAVLERRQSAIRELGGKLFNRCVRCLAVPGIHDTQCGFKLFSRAAARAVFAYCRIDNFSFDVETLFLARKLGYRVTEVPVHWRHQAGSKVRFVRDAARMLGTLVRIRLTRYQIDPALRARSPR